MSQRRPLREEIREAIEAETRPAHPALAARVRERIREQPAAGLRTPRLAAAIAAVVAIAVIAGLVATGRLLAPSPNPASTPTPVPAPSATPPAVVATPSPPSGTPAPTGTASSTPFVCTTGATSGAATGAPGPQGLTTVRAGAQPGYDRFVMEFDGDVPAYRITPQDSATFTRDPSGIQVTLRGSAGLLVVLQGAKRGDVPYTGPSDLTPGLTQLQEARLTGDSEGVVSFGLGLTRPGCYRVLLLTGPSRLVIDIAT